MAYTRHNWVCGEVINDTKMNNIEDGIEEALECCESSGVLYVDYDHTDGQRDIYDKTWQQAKDAYDAGRVVCVRKASGEIGYLVKMSQLACTFVGYFDYEPKELQLTALNASDYLFFESFG